MSLMIATCDYCGKDLSFHWGDKSYDIKITEHIKPCKHCNGDRNKIIRKSFYSFDCLKKWIQSEMNLSER